MATVTGPSQPIRVAGVSRCTAPAAGGSNLATSAPTPAGGTRSAPSNSLADQSRTLKSSGSAAAISVASQVSMVAHHGSPRSPATASARLVSGPAFARPCATASNAAEAASRAAHSAGLAARPSTTSRRLRAASESSSFSPASRASATSGLRAASCSQEAPRSSGSPPNPTVQARPPTRPEASTTATRRPASRSAAAAASPATPAPTTITSRVSFIRFRLAGRKVHKET